MRIKFAKFIALFVLFINIVIVYYNWRLFSLSTPDIKIPPLIKAPTKAPAKHVSRLISVVIRNFELHQNDISATVESFLNVFPNIQIFILSNALPYPPLHISYTNATRNVRILKLTPDLNRLYPNDYPLSQIKTKYVLCVPDSTRIFNRQSVQQLLSELGKGNQHKIVANHMSDKQNASCWNVEILLRKWTLHFSKSKNNSCHLVLGKHVTLLETSVLKEISSSFLFPFPQSLYLQTAALKYKVALLNGSEFHEGIPILKSHHAKWKKQQLDKDRQKELYQRFSIKKVQWENGTTEWFGCTKDTPSCFGAVLDQMPSYIYEGKWTPPCCLANLRKTAKHVFSLLNGAGIRYWLEGGSLLGAMRHADIIPWDHDVDIGVNRDDINRCVWIRRARIRPVLDGKGFLWEKVADGNFFRVHFSKTNRIFLNLLPFYTKNGTMTRGSRVAGQKNADFPEQFLHPMSSIEFVGENVPSPNNIRDFLELKFGKGVVENLKYPDLSRVKFPT